MAKSVKQSIKEGIVPKGKKKSSKTGTAAPKKEVSNKVENNTTKLPAEKQGVYIVAKQVGEGKPIRVQVSDITATSQQVYVNDIHSANPEILAVNYYVIMPNTAHVVLRLSEKEYNELLAMKENKRMKNLYSVVDCAVYPSLTYGSWSLSEITNGLPDVDQVADYDAKFKKLDIQFHNQPVHAELMEEEEEWFIGDDEEEKDEADGEFEIDFGDED